MRRKFVSNDLDEVCGADVVNFVRSRCRVERVPPWESTGLLAATGLVYRTVESSSLQESWSSVSSSLQTLSRRPILLRLYMGQG